MWTAETRRTVTPSLLRNTTSAVSSRPPPLPSSTSRRNRARPAAAGWVAGALAAGRVAAARGVGGASASAIDATGPNTRDAATPSDSTVGRFSQLMGYSLRLHTFREADGCDLFRSGGPARRQRNPPHPRPPNAPPPAPAPR